VQDARYAVRTLLRSPGFTSVAVLTLALGIGANSAIFSFVDGVLLKPLPYRDPQQIVLVWEKPPGGVRNVISTMNFLDWKEGNTVFEHIAATSGTSMTLSGVEQPVLLRGGRVSASYFEVYGVEAALGRTFAADEDEVGKDHVIVLSHRLWSSQFGSDPTVVGRTLTLDSEPYSVIGVLPEGSAFERGSSQFWRPLAFKPTERARNFHWLTSVARLKTGVTLDQAQAQMNAIGARIAHDYPDSNKDWGVTVQRYADVLVGDQLKRSLWVLLSAVGMLLLIGCANLANLALARGTSRDREVAVRAALGAGRWRLVRQFLTENIVLSIAGGLAGLALGYGMMAGLQALLPPFILPREAHVTMDVRVLLFSLAISVLTGVVFGLAPTMHVTRLNLASTMKEAGRGSSGDLTRRRLRSALVVIEMALAFMLLSGAGLLIRSFFHLLAVDTGFDDTNILTMELPVPNDRFPEAAQLTEYYRTIVSSVEAVPGVREAAVTSALPLQGWGYGMPFQIASQKILDRANRRACFFKMVGPSYFHALGIKIVKGRGLTEQDRKGTLPVTVISQAMVDRYFGGKDPVGERILIQEIVPGRPQLGPEIPWEVVGVVADEQVDSLDSPPSPGAYVSIDQSPVTGVGLLVRGNIEPSRLQQSIERAIHQVNKDQPLPDIKTLSAIRNESTASTRLRTMLFGVFAGLAVLLSAIGIYGVVSYSVAQRTQELGIRAALGASKGVLLRMVLGHGLILAVAGLALGIGGSLALTRWLATLLFNVKPNDPLTLGLASALLALVALLACYVPARRAAAMDPLAALRCE
jgi:putative ABC transport system permease protein